MPVCHLQVSLFSFAAAIMTVMAGLLFKYPITRARAGEESGNDFFL